MFEIKTREVPEQHVLTEQSHLRVSALPEWTGAALGRQHGALASAGAPSVLPSFIVFHGEVTEETAGTVEVCTPVAPELAARLGLPSRVEPAHGEAYTTITKALVDYPQILTAYDAVESWLRERDVPIVGSPREVYFADFVAAGQDDEVVDIAFPIAL